MEGLFISKEWIIFLAGTGFGVVFATFILLRFAKHIIKTASEVVPFKNINTNL